MTPYELTIDELVVADAERSDEAISFVLRIDGEVRRYDAPYHTHGGGALRGFDFPVEVRHILRVHGAASREMVRLLLRVMDDEQVEFPQRLTVRQESEELQAV